MPPLFCRGRICVARRRGTLRAVGYPGGAPKHVRYDATPAGKIGTILLLLVPLGMVAGLVNERQARQAQTLVDFKRGWGRDQTVAGPLLIVPIDGPTMLIVNGSYFGHDGSPATPLRSFGKLLGPQRYDGQAGAFVSSDAATGITT
jgi:hypothetical protein